MEDFKLLITASSRTSDGLSISTQVVSYAYRVDADAVYQQINGGQYPNTSIPYEQLQVSAVKLYSAK